MKRDKQFEYGCLVLSCIILLVSILADTYLLNYIPKFLLSKDQDMRGMMLVLFQVQASVATLGIALISILTSFSDKVVFGLPISRYVLHMRPRILKHKIIVILELLLLVINYMMLCFNFYNIVAGIFIISIVLLAFMINTTYIVFNGIDFLKKEIHSFILSCVKRNNKDSEVVLEYIQTSFYNSTFKKEFYQTRDNVDILITCFGLSISDIEIVTYNTDWEKILRDLFLKLLDKKERCMDNIDIYLHIEQVISLLDKNKITTFTFWDTFSIEFFRSITLELVDKDILEILIRIRNGLYKILLFDDQRRQCNNFRLSYYSSRVFNEIAKEKHKESEKFGLMLYNNIKNYVAYSARENEFDDEIKQIEINELIYLVKTFIDNEEKDVITNAFFNDIKDLSFVDNVRFLEFYYCILIYIYYLAERESIISEKFKKLASKLLQEEKRSISIFISHNFDMKIINKHSICFIRDTLRGWEFLEEGKAKYSIMDSVINDFLVFNTLYNIYNPKELAEMLGIIAGKDLLSFYTSFAQEHTKSKYSDYLDIFCENMSTDIAIDINRLESCLVNVYKLSEIKESYNNKMSEQEKYTAQQSLVSLLKEELEKITDSFQTPKVSNNMFTRKFTHEFHTYSYFFKEEDFKDYISWVRPSIINFLVKELLDHMTIKECNFNDNGFLNEFFTVASTYNGDLDTLIGYRASFYRNDRQEEFKLLEQRCKKIFDHRLQNIIGLLDSSKIYIKEISLAVTIEEPNVNKMMDDLSTDDNGDYLYNVTNNIYIPFDKKELQEYLKNSRKDICFSIEFEYTVTEDVIGVIAINTREESLI